MPLLLISIFVSTPHSLERMRGGCEKLSILHHANDFIAVDII